MSYAQGQTARGACILAGIGGGLCALAGQSPSPVEFRVVLFIIGLVLLICADRTTRIFDKA